MPQKERYQRAPVTLRAEGKLSDARVACNEAGLHPATGVDGSLACSGNMLLQVLVACAGITLNAVATALGFRLRAGAILAEGELDFRGTLGVDKEVPVGFREIRLRFELDTDELRDLIASRGN